MSLEENKTIARRHIKEVLEQGHVELIDTYYPAGGPGPGPDKTSAEQWRDVVLWYHKNAPGFKCTILNMVAEGDDVAVYTQVDITYRAIHPDHAKARPPLDRPITWRNIEIMRIVDGNLISQAVVFGWNDMLEKEGVLVPRKIETA